MNNNNNKIFSNDGNDNRRSNQNNNFNNQMHSNDNQNDNNYNYNEMIRRKNMKEGYGNDNENNFTEDQKVPIDFNKNNFSLNNNNNLANDDRTGNSTRKEFENDGFEGGKGRGRSTMPLPNNLGINYSLKNATDPVINEKNNFGKTDNNFNLGNNEKDDNNYYSNNNNSRSNQNNNMINSNTKNNTNNNNNNNTNNMLRNQFQNRENNDNIEPNIRENNNNDNNNNIQLNEEEEELVLVDKDGNKIYSEGRKQFKGEQVQEIIKSEGLETTVKTKDGKTEKLEVLKNEEGEFLVDEHGNPLLGKDYIYYVDKNGKPIVLLNKNIIDGDKVIPVLVKKVPFDPYKTLFNTTIRTNNDFNSANNLPNVNNIFGYITVGLGGTGYSELKKSRGTSKNRTRLIPKGDGDAKAPIKKKRRKKSTKK